MASPTPADSKGPIICPGHSRPVPFIEYSRETPDGVFLISACLDGKAMLRDSNGDWIGTFSGHRGAIWSATLNSDATRAVTAAADSTARIWNAETGEEVVSFQHKHIVVKTAVFSLDGTHVFTGGAEKKVRIFDLAKPDAAPQIMEGSTETISHIIATPDSNILLSCGSESQVRVWDRRTLKTEATIATGDKTRSLNGSVEHGLVMASAGKQVHMLELKSMKVVKTVELPGKRQADCAAYDQAGKRLYTGHESSLWVTAFDLSQAEAEGEKISAKELGVFKGHHGPVRSLAINPTNQTFASGSEDGTIRIWDLSSVRPE